MVKRKSQTSTKRREYLTFCQHTQACRLHNKTWTIYDDLSNNNHKYAPETAVVQHHVKQVAVWVPRVTGEKNAVVWNTVIQERNRTRGKIRLERYLRKAVHCIGPDLFVPVSFYYDLLRSLRVIRPEGVLKHSSDYSIPEYNIAKLINITHYYACQKAPNRYT